MTVMIEDMKTDTMTAVKITIVIMAVIATAMMEIVTVIINPM